MKRPSAPFVNAYNKSLTTSQRRIQLIDLFQVGPPPPDVLKKSLDFYFTLSKESHIPYVKSMVANIVSSLSNSYSIQVTGRIIGEEWYVDGLHNAIGGFVSRCGWNSILESSWTGVPIATWSIYAEQQINAFRMVKELGLAMEMRLDYRIGGDLVMAANEIERAVKSLMDGDNKIRRKVEEMAELDRKSLMDG